jgi:hypothetical protein
VPLPRINDVENASPPAAALAESMVFNLNRCPV